VVSTIPDRVARFREEYRGAELGPSYSGWGHFLFTTLGARALAAILAAASRLHDVHGAFANDHRDQ